LGGVTLFYLQVLEKEAFTKEETLKVSMVYEMSSIGSCLECLAPSWWHYIGRWWKL
jgi:hypothetical protein